MADVGEDQDTAKKAVEEMFEAIPRSKRMEFLEHLNEVLIYIGQHPPKKK